jgi:hypothetical protein
VMIVAGGGGDDLEAGRAVEDRLDPGAGEGVTVDDGDADHLGLHYES